MKRYPIDGLWLTDAELARYFSAQLANESHLGVRRLDVPEPTEIKIPNEQDFESKKPPKPAPRLEVPQGGVNL